MHKSNGLAKTWHTRKTTFGLRCVFVTVVFVSRLCGARSVQCFSVVVGMMVLVFVSSVVAVMVGELCVVFLKGGPLDDERKGHSRSEVSQFRVFRVFLCGRLAMCGQCRATVVNVAGGAD